MRPRKFNLITATDSYKATHWKQYPPGTEKVFSFFESRGGVFPTVTFFGLQYLLARYFAGAVVSAQDVADAKEYFAAHFGDKTLFNEAGWMRIVNTHGGCLPVVIRAVLEGTTVPTGNVLMTVENTDPELPWITNYLETLLVQAWYPSTVATQSREMRRVILGMLEKTGDPALVDYKLHDFGYRGSTSVESAGIGGAAHLVNFNGTDTLAAINVARDYYGEPMAGFSIPAAEHSTITSWGKDREADAFENMLTAFPKGLVAVVSDSYDIFAACKEIWGAALKEKVLARDGLLVVRPDSGDPPETVKEVLSILGDAFGYSVNAKGYKVLHPKVRVIQGDGIDYEMLQNVLEAMANAGWSADNIAFGSGGGLLQKVNRDTQKFAFKCSAVQVEGAWRDVYKNPVTDPGKRSKAGRLALVRVAGSHQHQPTYTTMREEEAEARGLKNELAVVFKNGALIAEQKFSDIRARARYFA